jgi:hypothetical protein
MSTNEGPQERYEVIRKDGSSTPGGKHHGCEFWVLDLDHDKHSVPAVVAYAASCESDLPQLARDLRIKALRRADLQPDADGSYYHPAVPTSPADDWEVSAWLESLGCEAAFVSIDRALDADLMRAFMLGGGIDAWEAVLPPGGGWFVLSLYHSEDGSEAAACLARKR